MKHRNQIVNENSRPVLSGDIEEEKRPQSEACDV